MNSSSASDTASTVHGCVQYIPQGTFDQTTPEAYGWIVFIAVINIITCPLTAATNALIIIVVKTKHRLKTMSNIALACLSTTDLAMGVIGQPIFISVAIAELQRDAPTYCIRLLLSRIALRVLSIASLSHLAMLNVERYIAIKRPLKYETIVTEKRLICLSALLWISVLLLNVSSSFIDKKLYLAVDNGMIIFCVATIVLCQVLLYHETRRHQKQIATHQVSLEARGKFLKERKAFKVTATVLFFLILCYLPSIVARTLISYSVVNSVNLAYVALSTAYTTAILNSLVNPIIYCVRIAPFRVAFIQLMSGKKPQAS